MKVKERSELNKVPKVAIKNDAIKKKKKKFRKVN